MLLAALAGPGSSFGVDSNVNEWVTPQLQQQPSHTVCDGQAGLCHMHVTGWSELGYASWWGMASEGLGLGQNPNPA